MAPVCAPTKKLRVSVSLSWDEVFTPSSLKALELASRRHKLVSQTAPVTYTPTRPMASNLSYRYEQRSSNDPICQYDDKVAAVGVTFMWGRYPLPP